MNNCLTSIGLQKIIKLKRVQLNSAVAWTRIHPLPLWYQHNQLSANVWSTELLTHKPQRFYTGAWQLED